MSREPHAEAALQSPKGYSKEFRDADLWALFVRL